MGEGVVDVPAMGRYTADLEAKGWGVVGDCVVGKEFDRAMTSGGGGRVEVPVGRTLALAGCLPWLCLLMVCC